MKHFVIIGIVLCLTQTILAQNKTFENRTVKIAQRIDSIMTSEKAIMKKELKKIDDNQSKGALTSEEADAEKKKLAVYHSERINLAVAEEEKKMQQLIQDKVNNNLETRTETTRRGNSFFPDLSAENMMNDTLTGLKREKRFTSQFVLALGMSALVNNEDAYYGEGFKTNPLGSGEFGFSFKYRLKDESPLWNVKVGFSFMSSAFAPESDNDIFIKEGRETYVQDAGFDIKQARLGVLYMAIPFHLEIDLSKPQFDKNTKQYYLRSQTSFRAGIGGYFGVRLYTEHRIRYDEDGKKIWVTERDDFNVNTFTFGPSAYIGYGDISLYGKYDMNPLFRHSPVDVNNLSLGIRFDFN